MSSTIAHATLTTPPWHTATTRSPGWALMISSTRCAMRVRNSRRLGSPKSSQCPSTIACEARIRRRRAAPPSGCSCRLARRIRRAPSMISTSSPWVGAIGSAVSTRAAQRARHDGVDALASASQSARRCACSRPAAVSPGSAGTPPPPSMRSGRPCRTQSSSISCTSKPSACSSSASATAGSLTLIVVMPIARAGLRLMPRSSRNTACDASDVQARRSPARRCAGSGLRSPFDRRLDDHVEAETVVERTRRTAVVVVAPVVRQRGGLQAVLFDDGDGARHLGARAEPGADQRHELAGVEADPGRVGLGFERVGELVHRELAAFEGGPRTLFAAAADERAQRCPSPGRCRGRTRRTLRTGRERPRPRGRRSPPECSPTTDHKPLDFSPNGVRLS